MRPPIFTILVKIFSYPGLFHDSVLHALLLNGFSQDFFDVYYYHHLFVMIVFVFFDGRSNPSLKNTVGRLDVIFSTFVFVKLILVC